MLRISLHTYSNTNQAGSYLLCNHLQVLKQKIVSISKLNVYIKYQRQSYKGLCVVMCIAMSLN